MIDVGNDREFGFLYQPSLECARIGFQPAFGRRSARQGAAASHPARGFFKLPGRTESAAIQIALLRRLSTAIPEFARPRGPSWPTSLRSRGASKTIPSACALFRSALEGTGEEPAGRVEADRPESSGWASGRRFWPPIRELIRRDEAAPSLLPVLRWPAIHDAEVSGRLLHGWPRLSQPQRLQAIEVLLSRPVLVDVAEPREQVMEVLRRGVTDPSPAVRERTLRGINSLPALWAGKGASKLLLSALADDEPALRAAGAHAGLDQGRFLEHGPTHSNI